MYTSVLVRVLARVGVNVVLIATGGHSIRVNELVYRLMAKLRGVGLF